MASGHPSDSATPATSPGAPARARGIPIAIGLGLAIALVLVLTVVPTLIAGYRTARDNTFELARDKAELAIRSMEDRIRLHLDPVVAQLDYVRSLIEVLPEQPSPEALDSLLQASLAAVPQVAAIALVAPDLQVRRAFRNRPLARPSVDDWSDDLGFRRMIEGVTGSQAVTWAGLFFAERVDQPFLNALLPIRRDGRFAGALLAGISLSQLSTIVNGLSRAERETAFILYDREHVLAHPAVKDGFAEASDEAPLPTLAMIGDPVLARLSAFEPVFVERTTAPMQLDLQTAEVAGEDYVMVLRELAGYGPAPWILGLHIPLDVAVPQLARLEILLWGGLALLAVAALVAAGLGGMLARPIRHLAQAAGRIRDFDVGGAPQLRGGWFRELHEAAAAFNTMTDALRWLEGYVPKQLVRRLMRHRSWQALASEEREVTVMFTDIVGFTALAESMASTEVTVLLNEHFTLIARCIEATDGSIDKYIGDAAMAFWGAPEEDPAHARKACEAAVAIARAIRADNAARRADGHPSLRLHVGIHTGRVVVGNIGAPSRVNYTLIGDAVNVAERLEELARRVGTMGAEVHVLVSRATAENAGPVFRFHDLGPQVLRGRRNAVEVLELEYTLDAIALPSDRSCGSG